MRKLKLEELNRLSPEEFKKSSKLPVIIVCDNIRSGLNVGAIFRTADAFAVEKILLCGISAKPPHREITKTAIGATLSVDWESKPGTAEAILELKNEGYSILGLEQTTGSADLNSFNWSTIKKAALVLGHEVEGISDDALKLLDAAIEIPQYGTKHSLNVSIAAGIALWEMNKIWR